MPRVYNNHNLYVPKTERVIKRNAHIHQVGYFNRTQLSTDRQGRKKMPEDFNRLKTSRYVKMCDCTK